MGLHQTKNLLHNKVNYQQNKKEDDICKWAIWLVVNTQNIKRTHISHQKIIDGVYILWWILSIVEPFQREYGSIKNFINTSNFNPAINFCSYRELC